ncbi:MAG: Uma2 family endonuclease [Polyangiaceae bacterium]|nr:Uma2 family endonuclease [Polyangiaceae bacterium]
MGEPATRQATYDDLLALPRHVVGELIHGVLHVQPRPASPHARAASSLGGELYGPFDRGRGGPGGWIILHEPELHLRGGHVVVPDLAGWRRERMPELLEVSAFELPPDWLCDVISASTAAVDRAEKLPLYAAEGVAHVWLVDPGPHTLEVLRLDGATYRLLVTHRGDARVRAEPFAAGEIDLSALWSR